MKDIKFKTIIDLVRIFPDERSCHEYFASQRWSDGVITCPHCENETAYVFKDGIRYKCCKCKQKFTAKTGTFMEASKLPAIKWIMAMYLVLHKKGISSIQLGKDVGVTQKTAWFMLHRIRVALGNESEEMLEGEVEIDETFVGGKSKFKHKNKRKKYNPGRNWPDKVPVMGMLQRGSINSRGDLIPGKVRAVAITDITVLSITKAVAKHVKIGSTIMGDGAAYYRVLEKRFNVQQVDHGRSYYVDGNCHTNTLEGFWSQFKKGITGIYHKTTRRHLNKYVSEFAFKYNNRNLGTQQQIECVISQMNCRLKYKDLISA